LATAVAVDAAAAAAAEILITAIAVASVANAVVKIRDAAKTPAPEEVDRGSKTPLPRGVKPSAIPIVKSGKVIIPRPAVDNILQEQDEPLFVFKQRNQAVDPTNPDQKLPEFGGDMIMVFTTSQGVTDPSYDQTRVIGTFS
jgi:hypothetical protein